MVHHENVWQPLENPWLGSHETRLMMAAFQHIGATKTLNAMLVWET
jgi:hypothetical protein